MSFFLAWKIPIRFHISPFFLSLLFLFGMIFCVAHIAFFVRMLYYIIQVAIHYEQKEKIIYMCFGSIFLFVCPVVSFLRRCCVHFSFTFNKWTHNFHQTRATNIWRKWECNPFHWQIRSMRIISNDQWSGHRPKTSYFPITLFDAI